MTVNDHSDSALLRELRRYGFQCRSPRQDDFAKRPILSQMAQGFARLAEGIDPLDDRLD